MHSRKSAIWILILIFVFAEMEVTSGQKFISERQRRRQNTEPGALSGFSSEGSSRGPNLLFNKRFPNKVFAIGWPMEVDYVIYNVGTEPAFNVFVTDQDFSEHGFSHIQLKGKEREKAMEMLGFRGQGISTNEENEDEEYAKDAIMVFNVGDLILPYNLRQMNNRTLYSLKKFAGIRFPTIAPGENKTYTVMTVPIKNQEALGVEGIGKSYSFEFHSAKVMYTRIMETKENFTQIGWSNLELKNNLVRILSNAEAYKLHGSKQFEVSLLVLMVILAVLIPYSMYRRHTLKYNTIQKFIDNIKVMRKVNKKTKKRGGKSSKHL